MNLGPLEILVSFALIAAVLAALLWGNRPTPERFATVNGLTLDEQTRADVAVALRRTYRGRMFGAGASFAIALVFGAVSGVGLNFTRGLAAILAGTLIGIALAQFTPTPAAGAIRSASLEARNPDDYRPRRAKLTVAAALAALLGYAAAFLLIAATGTMSVIVVVVAAVGLGVVILGAWLQRRIVEHAQVRVGVERARVDDALRSSAVRAVHHATIGLLLCGTAFLGVTGAGWGPIQVEVDNKVAFEIAPGATDVVTEGGRIWWTDFEGVRHSRFRAGPNHLTGWTQTHESTAVRSIGALLALVAGIGALVEWREAARAWRRPGSRRRSLGTDARIAPAGSSS